MILLLPNIFTLFLNTMISSNETSKIIMTSNGAFNKTAVLNPIINKATIA